MWRRSGTGTKTGTPLREIPQSISVVTSEAIEDQGAQTLQDALRYTAGVVADGYGIDSRTDSMIIRGTEANEYLDGLRRTYNYYVYTYRTDPYFMERIEILRGPASVLYGQAAVGGIINSVSKRPQPFSSSEITAEYGTFDLKQMKFDSTGALTADGKWLYRLTGLARDADTQVNFVDDDRLALQPGITFQPSADTSISCSAISRRITPDRRSNSCRMSARSSAAPAASSRGTPSSASRATNTTRTSPPAR
jgi:iron complex outermembrane receptor protein